MESKGLPKYALIVAGGVGARMGSQLPKQLIALQGKPILIHTIEKFLDFEATLQVVLVLHPSLLKRWPDLQEKYFSQESERIRVTPGGDSRTSSVARGLDFISAKGLPEQSLIAIHDAVRPFIGPDLLFQAYEMAARQGSAVVGVPVKSSMREVVDGQSKAVDRSRFYHVQTPQVFSWKDLWEAYRSRTSDDFTDDASLMEAAGHPISLCQGTYDNIKITTPEDLAIAEIILNRQHKSI